MTLDFSVCLRLSWSQKKTREELRRTTRCPGSNGSPSLLDAQKPGPDVPFPPILLDGEWMSQDTLETWQLLVTNRKRRVELKLESVHSS